jgi:hypothetical protein
MTGASSDALAGSLGLMMAASGPDVTEAALQRDDADWWRLCREADQRARQQPPNARLKRLRRLLEDNVSLERAWTELNQVTEGAPEPTIEALMYLLRSRGVKALEEPDTKRRLAQLSDRQIIEVGERLQRLKPHIARAWTTEDVKILFRLRGNLKNGGHR